MQAALYAFLAIVPWVAHTLLLRFVIQMEGWPVGLVGTLSRVVTVPLLAGWVLTTGAGWRRLRPRGAGKWLLVMGINSIIVNVLWFASVKWTTATNVAMLFRLDLVFVVLIGASLGLERIRAAQLALVPVMLVGLALVTEIHQFNWGGHLAGDTMVVVAAFGYAVNAFVIRHIMRVMDEGAVALYNHAMSMLGFLALGVAGGDFARTAEVFRQPAVWESLSLLGAIAAVGLPLYYVALRRMDVWKLRTFMLSAPVITAVAEWRLWGIPVSALQGVGALIILGGLVVLIRIESRASTDREEPTTTAQRPPPSAAEQSDVVPARCEPDRAHENRKDKIA